MFYFSRNITTVNKQTTISFPFNEKNFNRLIERFVSLSKEITGYK